MRSTSSNCAPAVIAALIAATAVMGRPAPAAAQVPVPPPAAQNPSPMVEETRAHERLVPKDLGGSVRTFAGPAGKPVELFVPDPSRTADSVDLVVHFLGAAWLPEQAVARLGGRTVVAVVNLGAGSGIYDRSFSDPSVFDSLLAAVAREVSAVNGRAMRIGRVTLVGFSAGHGAVRAILREPRHFARVDAVLLLDGMHTSYVPEGSLLAAGGTLDTTNLVAFTNFARAAVRGEKRFIVTHSEIFPGTFASTTETADWLLHAIGLHRTPVVRWGPRGMQQLSEVHAGRFDLLGFAGNSAPDHIDQLHAMPELLARLLGESPSWKLEWSDEFSGPAGSPVDSRIWTHDIGDGCAVGICGWGNEERESYTSARENVALDGEGHLAIVARRAPPGLTCAYGPCQYTSAKIKTLGKALARPGRVEARIKLPAGQGLWPAFWMLGSSFPATPWPQCGELDVMENHGHAPNETSSAIHGPGYFGKTPFVRGRTLPRGTFADDFHVFAVEWDSTQVQFSVDGAPEYTVTRKEVERFGPWAFDQPFFVVLNLAVGGTFDGNPSSDAIFPATMLVDYVRAYTR